MSETPTTIGAGGALPRAVDWEDAAELHRCEDGGGLFHNLKTIRRGTLAELVSFVMTLPEDKRIDYMIEKDGDHAFRIDEISKLFRRPDFPRADPAGSA